MADACSKEYYYTFHRITSFGRDSLFCYRNRCPSVLCVSLRVEIASKVQKSVVQSGRCPTSKGECKDPDINRWHNGNSEKPETQSDIHWQLKYWCFADGDKALG